jgi:hypothetical protein
MFPMDRKPIPVAVEYTSRGKRVTKTFPDAYAAKRFYTAKHRAGANPRVVAVPGTATAATPNTTTNL